MAIRNFTFFCLSFAWQYAVVKVKSLNKAYWQPVIPVTSYILQGRTANRRTCPAKLFLTALRHVNQPADSMLWLAGLKPYNSENWIDAIETYIRILSVSNDHFFRVLIPGKGVGEAKINWILRRSIIKPLVIKENQNGAHFFQPMLFHILTTTRSAILSHIVKQSKLLSRPRMWEILVR